MAHGLITCGNSNQIDAIADLFIRQSIPGTNVLGSVKESLTIETKDEDILNRIPNSSLIHLVFVNGLQNEYFTKKTFERTFSRDQPARKRKYYQLSQLVLRECDFGTDDVRYNGIVLFFTME